MAGTRIHNRERVEAIRNNGGIQKVLAVLSSPYGQRIHVAAVIALARIVEGLWPTWSDADDSIVNSNLFTSDAAQRVATEINTAFTNAANWWAQGVSPGETIVLAGALLRLHKRSGSPWRGRSPAIARLLPAFPSPPNAFASEAVTLKASTLRRMVASEDLLRQRIMENTRRAAEAANEPPLAVWVQVLAFGPALVWVAIRGTWWLLTAGTWRVISMGYYLGVCTCSLIEDTSRLV